RAHRGPESLPVVERVRVEAGETAERTMTVARWEDMAARGWHSGDDHVHAQLMSDDDARLVMTFAKATDTRVTNVLEMGNQQRTWYEQRGFGPAFRVRDGAHVLVPGQEDPRYRLG